MAQYQYANIPTPSPEDFGINATPQSSPILQGGIATAREIFPPLSMYLDWALNNPKWARYVPANIPLFLKDATVYEIFDIYSDRRNEKIQEVRKFVDDFEDEFIAFMATQGYEMNPYSELFINTRVIPTEPLTPHNLQQFSTPGDLLLRDAWRTAALGPLFKRTTYYPEIDRVKVAGQVIFTGPRTPPAPLTSVMLRTPHGYTKDALRDVVLDVNRRLKQQGQPGVTRQYIMKPGEQAIGTAGRRYFNDQTGKDDVTKANRDLSQRPMPMSKRMHQAYYAMLYSELAARGLIDANGQPTV